jgi:hypothetical protein
MIHAAKAFHIEETNLRRAGCFCDRMSVKYSGENEKRGSGIEAFSAVWHGPISAPVIRLSIPPY